MTKKQKTEQPEAPAGQETAAVKAAAAEAEKAPGAAEQQAPAEVEAQLAASREEAANNWDLYLRAAPTWRITASGRSGKKKTSAASPTRVCCANCCRCSIIWSGRWPMPGKAAATALCWKGWR